MCVHVLPSLWSLFFLCLFYVWLYFGQPFFSLFFPFHKEGKVYIYIYIYIHAQQQTILEALLVVLWWFSAVASLAGASLSLSEPPPRPAMLAVRHAKTRVRVLVC